MSLVHIGAYDDEHKDTQTRGGDPVSYIDVVVGERRGRLGQHGLVWLVDPG
jgi:hypothetical protein